MFKIGSKQFDTIEVLSKHFEPILKLFDHISHLVNGFIAAGITSSFDKAVQASLKCNVRTILNFLID